MINFKKRAMIEKLVAGYNKDLILKDVRGVINEIKAKTWADNIPLCTLGLMPISVGMTRQVPNWDTNPVIIQNLTSALIGRFLRAVFIQCGVQPNPQDQKDAQFMVKIAAATDNAQDAACRVIVGNEEHKYFKEHEHDETVKLISMMCDLEESAHQTKH